MGRVAVVTSHPIQYHTPWFRGLAERCDLHVFYAHRQSAAGQAAAGYGVEFDWDVDLLSGHEYSFLHNRSPDPNVFRFTGCDTPDIAEHLQGFDAVIITGWYLKSYLQALWAARRLGIPVLVRGDSQLPTQRSLPVRAAKQLIYRVLMRQYSAFLVVGARNRAYLHHYGVRQDRMFHVPHFVDNAFFASGAASADRDAVRREMGAAEDDCIVLFVGRFVDFKRPLDLVRALARLSRRHLGVFVGGGALQQRIERVATGSGVRVNVLGFRNQRELPGVYGAADVLALPSDTTETWGLVVNEAMACGTPAVVSDDAGCRPDMIDDGVTGHGFPGGDVPRLAAAIEHAARLRCDQSLAAALRAKVDAHSCEVAVNGTLEALEAVGGRTP